METQYKYDALDRTVAVIRDYTRPGKVASAITYDGLGRKSGMQDPDMGTWSYGYDAVGNVLTQTDSLAVSVYFSYDNMNRMTAKYYGTQHRQAGIPDVKYYYDNDLGGADSAHSWGRLRNVEVTQQGQGTKANGHGYLYDPRGLRVADVVTTTYNTLTYTVGYTYDVGSRLTTLTYPDHGTPPEQVSVAYNTQGFGLPLQLTTSHPGDSPLVSGAVYNERGQLNSLVQGSVAAGNLLTTTMTYDDATTQRGWPVRTLVTTAANTLLDLNMNYAANGDVSSVTQQASGPNSPVFTNTFTYDGFDRLSGAASTLYANEQYNFDTLGRMTSRTIGGTPYAYSYTDAAHVDAPTAYHGNNYGYDANSSQTSGTVAGRNETRSFDPEHRLAEVVTSGVSSATVDFVYDGNGKRLLTSVSSTSGMTNTLYIGNLYEETLTGGSNPPSISYYMLGGKMVGLRRANQSGGNGQQRLVGDHLGSTTLLVDASAASNVVQRQYHKPYGEQAFQYTAAGNLTSRNFTGQRLDTDTGLLYYGARYYDPALAYFISADPTIPNPTLPQSLNRMAYVFNNPLRFTDPLGYGPNDTYIFVNGCAQIGCTPPADAWNSSAQDRQARELEWAGYLVVLHIEFLLGHWGDNFPDENGRPQSWAAWEATHVQFLTATSATGGADALQAFLAQHPHDRGGIHLIGHSIGGAAILEYLARAHETATGVYNYGVALDPRIKSVVIIDPLLDVPFGFLHYDRGTANRLEGTYAWLHGQNGGVQALVVDTLDGVGWGTSTVFGPTYGDLPVRSLIGKPINNPDDFFSIPFDLQHRHTYSEEHVDPVVEPYLENFWK